VRDFFFVILVAKNLQRLTQLPSDILIVEGYKRRGKIGQVS